jgi:germination protein M
MKHMNKLSALLMLVLSVFLLGACGFGDMEENSQQIDPPQVDYVDEDETLTGENDNVDENLEMTWRELYLIDKNGYVVPQTLQVPMSLEVAKQSLEYLVKDGPVTNMLPNGFAAVLPAGTEINGINIQDGTATVDFSAEFTNYSPEEETRILHAITWTLTQFESIDNVTLQINGETQEVMPVNGTPINGTMSRNDGINYEFGNGVDIVNSKPITLYFLAQSNNEYYYVPVTRRVDLNKNDIVATVEELIAGPMYNSPLLTDMNPDVAMLTNPMYENGTLTLNFNESVLGDSEGTAISEYVLQTLVLSLTELSGVEDVAIMVNGSTEVMMGSGELLVEPVSRPVNVNKVKY